MMKQTLHLPASHPVLGGHRFNGASMLPGLSILDMTLQFLLEQGIDPRGISLANVAFYNAVSAKEGQAATVAVTAEARGAGWIIRFCDEQGAPFASLEAFREANPLQDERFHPPQAGAGGDIAVIYERCRRAGLVHDGLMKAEGSFVQDGGGLTADIRVPGANGEDSPEFIFHPTLLDGASLATGMAFASLVEDAEALFMPLSLGSFRWLRPLRGRCFAHVAPGRARRQGTLLIRDVTLYDAAGQKAAELTGFTCALVRQPGTAAPVFPAPGGEAGAGLRRWLAAALAKRLGANVTDAEAGCGFQELGLDSQGMLAIAADAGERLGLSLPPTLLFEHTSLDALAAHLEAASPAAVAAAFGTATASVPVTGAARHAEAAPAALGADEPIAIIGMAGRYPGAPDLDSFWRNLCAGVDSVTEIPLERWDHRRFAHLRSRTGRALSRWGGFVEGHDCFDARFFRISPREAEMMDPQERLFMEVCWSALEDAGHTPESVAPSAGPGQQRRVGVFAGVMHKDYTLVVAEAAGPEGSLPLSLNMAQIANRVSFFCNFSGPSIAVDTVCSSSLVAVHMAVESLRRGETDACLAGGVNLSLHPAKYQTYGQGNLFSTDGRCRAFGKGGDGYVPAEGVGAVLLKTLSRAIADGDPIHAVIRGSAVNHVGHVSGFTVPSPVAQAEIVRQALGQAGVTADSITCIEAHGTGTSLGDPIEIEGLTKAFRATTDARQFCAIGSVKSNIGHAEAAAGISGLTKLVLQLREAVLVPTLHAAETNPHIDFAASPFHVQRTLADWPMQAKPRRGAVSSFGATGTNAHAVLEEAPARAVSAAAAGPCWLPLSAQNDERLRAYAARLAAFLRAKPATPITDLAFTFQTGRRAMASRAVFEAADSAALAAALEAFAATGSAPALDAGLAGGRLAQAWLRGDACDWLALHDGGDRPLRIHAPAYPFARERHWVKAAAQPARPALVAAPEWTAVTGDGPERGSARRLVAPDVTGGFPAWLGAGTGRVSPLDVPAGAPFSDIAAAVFRLVKQDIACGEDRLCQLVVADWQGEALAGLARSAALEGLAARLQIVHASAASLAGEAALLKLLARASRSEEPLLREQGGALQARAWRAVEAVKGAVPWKDDGVYLVTGGAGGLGRLWADEILRCAPGAHVVLTGRSATPGMKLPEHTGLSYRQADVTDAASVAALIGGLLSRHGRLNGVIHSAGIVADGLMRGKEEAVFRAVLAPKVVGALMLDDATRHCSLDVFVLFSSGAGAFGNRGQADYATANAWLGGFAQARQARVSGGERSGRTLAIHWPLWEEGGMRPSGAVIAQWQRDTGLVPLSSRAGFEAFYRAFAQASPEALVLAGEEERLRAHFGIAAAGGAPVAPPVPDTAVHAAPPAAAKPSRGGLRQAVTARLKEVLSDVTKLPAAAIGAADPLADFGLDSVMAVEFGQRLAELSPEISHAIVYESADLAAMAELLLDRYGAACESWVMKTGVDAEVEADADADATPPPSFRPSAPSGERPAEPIAIIGMAGRYPGAPDLDAFWANLAEGRDAVTEIPSGRWSLEGFFEADRRAALEAGKSYGKWGGFLDGFSAFDPLFFQISPMEAAAMDPQERLFIETAWHAFEDAGYSRDEIQRLYGGRAGVFAGITRTGFNLGAPEQWRAGGQMLPATSFSSVANRVSYLMNLNGPSMPVDTMCSSSLTAVHEACEKLRHGACDMALAGGVNLLLHPLNYISASAQQMLSPDGRCKSFGAGANGYVPGEGVGAVVLKRLSDAERDGDAIHALILASAVNHNGRTNGYTVPNPRAQRDLIRQALAAAAIDAGSISHIEAHGTGTELGDPIEVEALREALPFSSGAPRRTLASVKSNIGHLEAAAGLAGLTKTVLQIRHGKIAPGLHNAQPNPKIDLAAAGFETPQRLTAWDPRDAAGKPLPRRAGVSSFGAGGANAHVIVAEYDTPQAARGAHAGPVLIVLSARTVAALRARATDLLAHLDAVGQDLPAAAFTLQVGREAFAERAAIVAASADELRAALRALAADAPLPPTVTRGRVGQGSRLADGLSGDDGMAGLVAGWARQGKLAPVAALWVEGFPIDWRSLYPNGTPRRVSLPGYPFERQEFWTPPVLLRDGAPRPSGVVESGGLMFRPVWQRLPEGTCECDPVPEIILHHPSGADLAAALAAGPLPAACFVMGRETDAAAAAMLRSPARLWFIGPTPEAGGAMPEIEFECLRLLAALKGGGLDVGSLDLRFLTRGAFGGEADGAGLAGLCHSLRQSGASAALIDVEMGETLDEASRAEAVRLLRAAPVMPRGDMLLLRHGALWQRRLQPLAADAHGLPSALKRGGRYVIIGGSGLIGRALTRHLISRYHAEVHWIGRTAPGDEGLRQRIHSFAELGVPPAYHQADARDAAALGAVAGAIGPVSGVIFAAMDFAFGGPADVTEQDFARVFHTKRAGADAAFRAFRASQPGFICHFSSIQAFAFADAANSAAYAAGICAADAMARRAMAEAPCPVGIINWGFWRAAIAGTILERNSGSMEEAEALACFERGLSLICSGRARELVCMRLPRSGEGTFVMPHEAVAPAAPDGAAEHMLRVLPVLPQQPPAVTGAEAQETFIRHAVRAVLVTLRTMNVLSAEAATPGDAAARAGIMPGFTRWLAEALRMLSEHGLAEETSRGYRLTAEGRALDAGEVDMQWRAARAEAGRDPGIAPMVALLSRCMDNLSAVLGGRVRATEQVFPAGEVGALGNVYEGNDWSDFFNGQLAGAVTRLAEDVVRREPARRLRIAEVGAGTGSTTRAVIAALEAQGASADYLYTDVSAAFTAHGRAAFGAGRPWMEFHVWNIDGAALPGAIAPGSCDIVIATNVLHATPDIRRALRNAKAALRPGGVLLLNETVWKTVFATLTFGLLDGWWAFADADLRIPGAPLLSGAQWLSVLEEEGFAPARLLTAPVRSAAQCVIAAQSDGWRLLPRLAEAAPPSAPGPRPVSQSMPQPAPAVAPASASFAAPDHAGVRQALAACLGEALNIAAAQIDGSVAFSEYGVDSIVGAQLVSLISRRLGIPLNASALYEHANLDALSRHLAAALAEAAGPHRVESPPSAPRPLTLEERFMAGELSAASLLEEIA